MTQKEEHEILFNEYYRIGKIASKDGDQCYWEWHLQTYSLLEKMGLLYEYELWRLEKGSRLEWPVKEIHNKMKEILLKKEKQL